ncbi:MAG: hypothetical protein R3342_11390 [Lutibacter sp.]|uniref:tetratricopeptide repeat protein n=1 Tax=Lutibacter sp. TaxID=1925666 RepID=UPI00299E40A3|nr:hypothetical protein [Lutibacter sp.]MDX1830138.1 hypothetical protein [Lutibacter sp.]
MKYLFIIFSLFTLTLSAQNDLQFDKRFVQCEDKWVAFTPNEGNQYTFGFIYIDEQAGLTLNYEGTFKILASGEFIPQKLDSTSMKVRLEPNNVLVALIPENKFEELDIKATPEWLKYYKTDINSVERLYKWGYMYNGWNECAKALTYLEKAKTIDPNYKGLSVEIAYSYNCLHQFENAGKILEEEITKNPADAYVNKEYIYSYSKTDNIDKAITQYNKSLKTVKDKTYNAENCFNIMQYYYTKNDKDNFDIWFKKFEKYKVNNSAMTQYAKQMKTALNK